MIEKAEEYRCGREWGWSGRKDIFTVSIAHLGPAAQHVMLAPPERWVTVPKLALGAIPSGLRAVIPSTSSPSSIGPTTLSHLWPFPWPPSSNDVSHIVRIRLYQNRCPAVKTHWWWTAPPRPQRLLISRPSSPREACPRPRLSRTLKYLRHHFFQVSWPYSK